MAWGMRRLKDAAISGRGQRDGADDLGNQQGGIFWADEASQVANGQPMILISMTTMSRGNCHGVSRWQMPRRQPN